MPSGRSTEISTSSTGASLVVPPQARQPRSKRTSLLRASGDREMWDNTSMVSAVPAGEVMARLEVLGINMPWAATMGTMSMEVRLPGMPPMQCLSATNGSRQLSRTPVSIMARVRDSTSSRSRPFWPVATRKAAISIFE